MKLRRTGKGCRSYTKGKLYDVISIGQHDHGTKYEVMLDIPGRAGWVYPSPEFWELVEDTAAPSGTACTPYVGAYLGDGLNPCLEIPAPRTLNQTKLGNHIMKFTTVQMLNNQPILLIDDDDIISMIEKETKRKDYLFGLNVGSKAVDAKVDACEKNIESLVDILDARFKEKSVENKGE